MCVAEIDFVQLLKHVWLFVTQKISGHQASLSIVSQSLLKFMSTDHMSVSLSICMYLIFLPEYVYLQLKGYFVQCASVFIYHVYWCVYLSDSNKHV